MTFHPRAGLPTTPSRPRAKPGTASPGGPRALPGRPRDPPSSSFVPFYLTAEKVWKWRGSLVPPGTGPPRIPTRNKCTNMMVRENRGSGQRQFHSDPIENSMLAPAPLPAAPSRISADWWRNTSISGQAGDGGFRVDLPFGPVIGGSADVHASWAERGGDVAPARAAAGSRAAGLRGGRGKLRSPWKRANRCESRVFRPLLAEASRPRFNPPRHHQRS